MNISYMGLPTCSAWYCGSSSFTCVLSLGSFHCSAAAAYSRWAAASHMALLGNSGGVRSYGTRKWCLDKWQRSLYSFPFLRLADPAGSHGAQHLPFGAEFFFLKPSFNDLPVNILQTKFFLASYWKYTFILGVGGGGGSGLPIHLHQIVSLRVFLSIWSTHDLHSH